MVLGIQTMVLLLLRCCRKVADFSVLEIEERDDNEQLPEEVVDVEALNDDDYDLEELEMMIAHDHL